MRERERERDTERERDEEKEREREREIFRHFPAKVERGVIFKHLGLKIAGQ